MKYVSRASRIREIKKLIPKLPKLSEKQSSWAISKCISRNQYFLINKRERISCSICGHTWKENEKLGFIGDENVLRPAAEERTCPNCGQVGRDHRHDKSNYRIREIYCFVTIFKGYQVLRYALVDSNIKFGKRILKPYFKEVLQRWINAKGEMLIASSIQLNMGTGFIVRDNFSVSDIDSSFYEIETYPKKRYLPILRKYGFKNLVPQANTSDQIHSFLSNPKSEILYKNGYKSLFVHNIFGHYHQNQVKKAWPSIRIAMRHKYAIPQAGLWLDYLDLCSSLGLDLRNPDIICPADLSASHALRLSQVEEQRRNIEAIAEAKLLQEQAESFKEIFERRKLIYKTKIKAGDITIRPLASIKDFKIEGDTLSHCVYQNDYYLRENVICFSAAVNGKRTETIEASLPDLKILQCRGKHNGESPDHGRILNAFEANKSTFAKQIKQFA